MQKTKNATKKTLPKKTGHKESKSKQAVRLALNTDLSRSEIARVLNTSVSNVCQALSRFGIEPKDVKAFREKEADMLAEIRAKFLNSLQSADINVENPQDARNISTSYGILYDKERLSLDKSTSNIAIAADDIAAIRALKAREAEPDVDI
ncbi:MAG: hypothetical protein WC132_04520 [Methanomethylophilus sp.]|jgi:hypothetical protein